VRRPLRAVIDRHSSFAKGLAFAAWGVGREGTPFRDLVSGRMATAQVAGPFSIADIDGGYSAFCDNPTQGNYYSFGDVPWLNLTGDFTVAVNFFLPSTATSGDWRGLFTRQNSTNGWGLVVDGSNDKPAFITFSGSSFEYTHCNSAALAVNTSHTLVGRCQNGVKTVWLNGVLQTETGTLMPGSSSGTNLQVGKFYDGTAGFLAKTATRWAAVWKRPLTDGEIGQFAGDPYAPFRPRTKLALWVPPPPVVAAPDPAAWGWSAQADVNAAPGSATAAWAAGTVAIPVVPLSATVAWSAQATAAADLSAQVTWAAQATASGAATALPAAPSAAWGAPAVVTLAVVSPAAATGVWNPGAVLAANSSTAQPSAAAAAWAASATATGAATALPGASQAAWSAQATAQVGINASPAAATAAWNVPPPLASGAAQASPGAASAAWAVVYYPTAFPGAASAAWAAPAATTQAVVSPAAAAAAWSAQASAGGTLPIQVLVSGMWTAGFRSL
jgi:hypothetical protein